LPKTDLLQGTLDLLILKVLTLGRITAGAFRTRFGSFRVTA
jgi:hypothetical protein